MNWKYKSYFRYFDEKVLDWLAREFEGSKTWKFTGNIPPNSFKSEVSEFEKKLDELDYKAKFESMLEANQNGGRRGRRVIKYLDEKYKSQDLMNILARKWLQRFLEEVDSTILRVVSVAVENSSKLRRNIEDTVFNFTGEEVSEHTMKGLNVGSNFVLHTSRSNDEARDKLQQELYQYLQRYRMVVERRERILEENLYKWLEVAVDSAKKEKDFVHHEFYSSVLRMTSISLGVGKRVTENSNKIDFKEFDDKGICVVEADKNVGICLIKIQELLKADQTLVDELGGKLCENMDAADVKKAVVKEINEFEAVMELDEKKFLGSFYGDRLEKLEESELPFLKVRPKVHKLSSSQLKKLDPSLLKYRPVVDASRTPLNEHSRMLTEYLRSLINRAEAKYLSKESLFVKNGHEIATIFRGEEIKSMSRKFFSIADLSSAYTFIFLNNLKVAIGFLGEKLGVPEWKNKLFIKISDLVFNNSYLETTTGVYKLNTCLPMGLNCSGESMDIVLLVCELVFLGKVEASEIPGFLEQFTVKDHATSPDSTSFLKYRRYRDDTFSVIEIKTQDVEKNLCQLGEVFLPALDINIQATLFVGVFLDVMFFIKFADGGFETMVKRKPPFPITFCHASSNMSSSIVKSIIGGEVLRHRRLCSNEKLVETNDECLTMELSSRGYSENYVRNCVKKRIEQIQKNYDDGFCLKGIKKAPEGLVYGTKCVYDEEWFTHTKLMMILRTSLPREIR